MLRKKLIPWLGRWSIVAGTGLVLLVSLCIWWQTSESYKTRLLNEEHAETQRHLIPYGDSLTTVMSSRFAQLEALSAFIQIHPTRTDLDEQFDVFAAGLMAGKEDIRAIQVFPNDGNPVYVYPIEGNEATLGRTLDILRNDERPEVRADVQQAIETREIVTSGPYELRQGGLGFVARLAVYQGDDLWGLVVIILDIPPILQEAGLDVLSNDLALALRDSDKRVFWGSTTLFQGDPSIYEITLPHGTWALAMMPSHGWRSKIHTPLLVFRLIGLGIVMLATTTTYLILTHQSQLMRSVKTGTASLAESEARYRRLAENAQDIIYRYRLRPNPGFEYVNPAVTNVTGYTPEEYYADPLLSNKLVHPDDRPLIEATYPAFRSLALRWVCKDGTTIWIELRNVPIYDEQGTVVVIEGIARDITAQKQAQIAEYEQRIWAEALRDTASALITALDSDAVMNTILENVARAVPHDSATIMLIEGDMAHAVYSKGFPAEIASLIQTLQLPLATTPNLYHMASTGLPYLVPDTKQWPHWVKIQDVDWTRSCVSAPIRSHGNVIGFLNLSSKTPGFFTEQNAQQLQAFADQASIAIERAQLYDEIRHHASDLEQRVKERTAQLNRTKDRIEAILNSSNDVIILCQKNSKMDIVNPAFARMFNNNPLSALFKPLSDLARPEHAPILAQAFQDVVETRHPKRLEITVQYLSSNPFDVDVLLSPIVEQDGALSGVVCSLRDNSERKRTEAQLRQLLQHEMELSEIQSRYVSMAAHDLRNPLAVIQAVVGTLQRHGARLSDEEKQAKYDLITRNIRTMDDLLNDVLTMGKIESGKRVFEPASLNVSTFCQNLVSEFQQTIDSAQRIIFSHTGNNNMVNMDAKLLHHILENLLSNAMKYSPPDSPVIFTLSSSPETVTFRIEDHGIGIPQEDQARLFEAFHRAKNTRKIPGTGLGLAIVKQAVELHNGTITCETTENVGTTFTVVLPVN